MKNGSAFTKKLEEIEVTHTSELVDKMAEPTIKDLQLKEKQRALNAKDVELEALKTKLEALKTALADYKEGEPNWLEALLVDYLCSCDFNMMLACQTSKMFSFDTEGAIKKLREADHLTMDIPKNFIRCQKILKGIPNDAFTNFV